MTADEDTPMEPAQKRLVDAARAVARRSETYTRQDAHNAAYWVPARQMWDLEDALNDYDLETGTKK